MFSEIDLYEVVPFVWPTKKQDRIQKIMQVKQALQSLDHPQVTHKLQTLVTAGPYYELIELLDDGTMGQHPLRDLLKFLNEFDSDQTQVVRRVTFTEIDEFDSSGDFELVDLYEDQKRQYNLHMMNKLSFPKLQKLLCDLYKFGNQKILTLHIKQLQYVDYCKVQLSTIKKAMGQCFIDQGTLNQIAIMACGNCKYMREYFIENRYIQHGDVPFCQYGQQIKLTKLIEALMELEKFRQFDQTILLSYQPTDRGSLGDCIWTRQQLIQSFVLFALVQCECTIANALGLSNGSYQPIANTINLCTDDYSWNENCWSKLRDYMPKTADKLNKRYKMIFEIPIYDLKTRTEIIYYAQSLVGYYHHNFNYGSMTITPQLQYQIERIVSQQPVQSDIGLILLVANACMFVQLLYAIK